MGARRLSSDSTAEEVKAAIEQTMQRFGRLDAVYANAGYGIFGQVDQTPEDAHRQIFEVNYFGTIRTINFALPHLRATRDGLKHILICSSAASEIGLPMFGPYSATKAAQDSIAGAMRAELRDQGIHVTSIHPVGTKTEFFAVAGDRSQEDALQHNAPDFFTQTAAHVARRIVAALRSPRAEVWPSFLSRLGLAGATALPELTAWVMKRHVRQLRRERDAAQRPSEAKPAIAEPANK